MDYKIKNRHRFKSKDIKKIVDQLKNQYSCDLFNDKSNVEVGDFEQYRVLLIDDTAMFMEHSDKWIFTLHGINHFKPREKFVTVDMGAVKYVTNGADVMSPGIVDADKKIQKGESVWIRDEKHKKALAVGIALVSGEDMIINNSGKAINIVHYVGDMLWDFFAKTL